MAWCSIQRTSVGYPRLTINQPLMLKVLLLFLQTNYHYLLILIQAYLLYHLSLILFTQKTWRLKLSRIRSVMRSLDVKKAVGSDGVSPLILKHCCAELSHPIYILFRRVCKSGHVEGISYYSHL